MARTPRSEIDPYEGEETPPVPPVYSNEGMTSGLANPDDYKTTQETSGPDPVSPAVEPVPATVLDIPPGQPYPTGNPPADPHEPKPE
jgi:hypothetical protein